MLCAPCVVQLTRRGRTVKKESETGTYTHRWAVSKGHQWAHTAEINATPSSLNAIKKTVEEEEKESLGEEERKSGHTQNSR